MSERDSAMPSGPGGVVLHVEELADFAFAQQPHILADAVNGDVHGRIDQIGLRMAHIVQIVACRQAQVGIMQRIAGQVRCATQAARDLAPQSLVALGHQAAQIGQAGAAHRRQPP